MAIGAGGNAFVCTVYAAPTGLQAFNRFDATLAVIDAGNVANNNEVHDELYSGYVVQTKSYSITSTGCSGGVPAGTMVPRRHRRIHDRRAQHRGRRQRHDAGSATRSRPTRSR